MAAVLNKLTANQVKTAKGEQVLADGGGLHLQVTAKGARSWIFRYRWQGKRPELGLGAYPAVTLADARRRAELARSALAAIPPRDPKDVLRAEQAAPTFSSFAEDWLEANLNDFRNAKHRQQWRNTLATYAEPLHDLRVDTITTDHVLACLKPIWNTKRETASRVRGRIERILDAAKAKGFRSGENPALWRGHLSALLPNQKKVVAHHAAMPFADLPGFMTRLRENSALSARALEFLILTCARSGEARGARWSEIDLEARLWVVPADRMKAGREHRVPLSEAAAAILKPLFENRISDFVFPAQGGKGCVSETALRKMLAGLYPGEASQHGFRSSFRDWAGETTSFPREVAEQALAHVVGDETERAYRRGDALEKRRLMMQSWADYCAIDTAGLL